MQTICYSIPLLSLVIPTSIWLQGMTYISAVIFHKHINFWSQFHNIVFSTFLVFDVFGDFKVCYLKMLPLVQTKVMRISRQPFPVKIMIDQKQLENVESFKYLGSILKNDGRCTCEIKCRIVMAKAAFSKKRALFTSTLDSE